MIDHDDTRLLEDAKYRALWTANKVWKNSFMLSSKERIEHLREVHTHEIFSLNQIAKICRVDPSTASRKLSANAGGGRFDPTTLTSLMVIRRAVISRDKLQRYLLEQVVEAGTSIGVLAKLTGASTSNVYRILNA